MVATNLINAYLSYKQERARIKNRQRLELERELEPYLHLMGEAIHTERSKNAKSMDEVLDMLGTRNRNLAYNAESFFRQGLLSADPEPVSTPDPTDPPEAVDTAAYGVHRLSEYVFLVTFSDGTEQEVTIHNGEVDVPDAWLSGSKDDRAKYREVIDAIRETAQGGS